MAQSKLYGNQKRIQVQKMEVKKADKTKGIEGDKFLYQNTKAIDQALYCLRSHAGFKLYMYLAEKNTSDNKWWHLSNKDFKDKTGVARSGYDTAVAELLHFGYLKSINDSNNDYIFTDYLNVKEDELEKLIRTS